MRVIAKVTAKAEEMCFVQYMPIKLPYGRLEIPKALAWAYPIVDTVFGAYFESNDGRWDVWHHKYAYLTVRHLYATRQNPGNRQGWHIDGYGGVDDNFIWCNWNPTEYLPNAPRYFGIDHEASLRRIEDCAHPLRYVSESIPLNTVVDIGRSIHRVADPSEGMRTFVKVTLSYAQYNLKGNAKNPGLKTWDNRYERSDQRNHPYVLDFPA